MSEVSPGPGWWLASDGRWYPPELAPPAPGTGRLDGGEDLEQAGPEASPSDRFIDRVALAAVVLSGLAALTYVLIKLVFLKPCPDFAGDFTDITLPALALLCVGLGVVAWNAHTRIRSGGGTAATVMASIAFWLAILLLVGGVGGAVASAQEERRSDCLVF